MKSKFFMAGMFGITLALITVFVGCEDPTDNNSVWKIWRQRFRGYV